MGCVSKLTSELLRVDKILRFYTIASKKTFIKFFKLAGPFFALTLLAWFGLKCVEDCDIVFGGDCILLKPFSI